MKILHFEKTTTKYCALKPRRNFKHTADGPRAKRAPPSSRSKKPVKLNLHLELKEVSSRCNETLTRSPKQHMISVQLPRNSNRPLGASEWNQSNVAHAGQGGRGEG